VASIRAASQMRRFVACDLGFHTVLMRLAANARMMKIVNETRLLIRIFAMPRKGHGVELLEDIHRRHSGIVCAIAGQDSQAGMLAISEHIQVSLHERLEDFDHWKIETELRELNPPTVGGEP
jgi:DNA-binding GntR family transcriptional regulator